MAAHLPEDNLEGFLKKSFEGYREDPPDELWASIEAGLPDPVRPVNSFKTPFRFAAAAAAVLLVLLVAQQLRHVRQEASWLSGSGSAPTYSADAPAHTPSRKGALPTLADAPIPGSAAPTAPPSEPAKTDTAPARQAGRPQPKDPPMTVSGSGPARQAPHTVPPDGGEIPPTRQADHPQESVAEVHDIPDLPAVAPTPARMIPASLASLAIRPCASRFPEATLWLPAGGIRPIPTPKGTIGWQTALLSASEQIRKVFPARIPPIPGQAGKIFNDNRAATGTQLATGLTLTLPIHRRVSFGSGLLYRRTDIRSTHQAIFRFQDRTPPGGSGHNTQEHVFTYDLNTATGALEMDVRVSAEDAIADIPEDEELKLQVVTHRQDRHLSIPLLLRYGRPFGRMEWSATAGVLLNSRLSSDYGSPEITSDNPRFKARAGKVLPNKYDHRKSLTTHYYLATGVTFRMGRTLSLAVEPILVGSIGNQQRAPFIEATTFQAGLSTGLQYAF